MTSREKKFIDEKFKDVLSREKAYKEFESGTPLAYVLGEWYFYDEIYKVSPECLIPQPDTELLVEYAIKNIKKNATFLDLCTGSGCVGISVLAHRPDLSCVAVDISDGALALAKENAILNGVNDRIELLKMDITSKNFSSHFSSKYAAILSNPPYINTDVIDSLSEEVKKEPRIALDGGNDGMNFYRAIRYYYKELLEKNGLIALEIGYDQKEKILSLFGSGEVKKDYGGNERLFILNA